MANYLEIGSIAFATQNNNYVVDVIVPKEKELIPEASLSLLKEDGKKEMLYDRLTNISIENGKAIFCTRGKSHTTSPLTGTPKYKGDVNDALILAGVVEPKVVPEDKKKATRQACKRALKNIKGLLKEDKFKNKNKK